MIFQYVFVFHFHIQTVSWHMEYIQNIFLCASFKNHGTPLFPQIDQFSILELSRTPNEILCGYLG